MSVTLGSLLPLYIALQVSCSGPNSSLITALYWFSETPSRYIRRLSGSEFPCLLFHNFRRVSSIGPSSSTISFPAVLTLRSTGHCASWLFGILALSFTKENRTNGKEVPRYQRWLPWLPHLALSVWLGLEMGVSRLCRLPWYCCRVAYDPEGCD